MFCTFCFNDFFTQQVVDGKDERDAIFEQLEEEAKALDDERKEAAEEGPKKKQRKLGLDFDESDDEDEEYNVVKKEISAYRQEPILDQDGDALLWWRKKKDQYPHLARLCRYKLYFIHIVTMFWVIKVEGSIDP